MLIFFVKNKYLMEVNSSTWDILVPKLILNYVNWDRYKINFQWYCLKNRKDMMLGLVALINSGNTNWALFPLKQYTGLLVTKYFNNGDQTALLMQLSDCNAAALTTSEAKYYGRELSGVRQSRRNQQRSKNSKRSLASGRSRFLELQTTLLKKIRFVYFLSIKRPV